MRSPPTATKTQRSQIKIKTWLFKIIFGCIESSAACGLSLVAASRGHSSPRCTGLSLRQPLLLQSTGSRCAGFSSCGTWAQQPWLTGLVALWHAVSSQTRARTRVPFIGRQILNHCITREVPRLDLLKIIIKIIIPLNVKFTKTIKIIQQT